MTANKKGIFAQLKKEFSNNTLSFQPEVQVGRVTDIILNHEYPKIEEYGGINGIGTIFFELNKKLTGGKATAKPFFPQLSAYPLVNELVLIFELPNSNIGESVNSKSFYYVNMISLWNHPHHNAYPNPQTANILPPEQQKDYEQTKAGSVRRVTDGSTEINFNSKVNPSQATFEERSNIHPLLPFAGDVIHEGRWGNSIRFGSTANPNFLKTKDVPLLNNWSNITPNGNPITIIRNGQPKKVEEKVYNQDGSERIVNGKPVMRDITEEGWKPTTENINKDLSSIYLTSNQLIPISVAKSGYQTYNDNTRPTQPGKYTSSQVIINSNRLVFNAQKDHILLSAEKSIGLSSVGSLNFETKEFLVRAPQVKLGSEDATESVILGDKFLPDLMHVIKSLEYIAIALKGSAIYPEGKKIKDGTVVPPAVELEERARTFIKKIETYKSKTTKTI